MPFIHTDVLPHLTQGERLRQEMGPERYDAMHAVWDQHRGVEPTVNQQEEPYVAPVLDFSNRDEVAEPEFDDVDENYARMGIPTITPPPKVPVTMPNLQSNGYVEEPYVAPTVEGLIQNELRKKERAKRQPNYGGGSTHGEYIEEPYVAPTL